MHGEKTLWNETTSRGHEVILVQSVVLCVCAHSEDMIFYNLFNLHFMWFLCVCSCACVYMSTHVCRHHRTTSSVIPHTLYTPSPFSTGCLIWSWPWMVDGLVSEPSGPPVSAFWVLGYGCGNKIKVIVLARRGLYQLSYLVLVFLTVSLPFCKICKVFSDIQFLPDIHNFSFLCQSC